MERPQVIIVQSQEEQITPANIDSWEAEQLLRKYGHLPQHHSSITHPQPNQKRELTFEEMLAESEAQRNKEEARQLQKRNGPSPITFNSEGGYDSEVRYSTDEDTGFGFRIEISSDMKIPKY